MIKYLVVVSLIGIFFYLVSSILALRQTDDLLHVVFCDVGQGDATLIQYRHWQVLVDGGVDATVLRCLEQHLPFMDQTIEVVLATHAHADHINGLSYVMEKYRTPVIMTNGLHAETADFAAFNDAIVKQLQNNSRHLVVGQGLVIRYGLLEISIVAPDQGGSPVILETETELWDTNWSKSQQITDHNEPSIATYFTFGNFSFLVTGDIYEEGELALIASNMITPTSILKAGHHGSKTSSSVPFLTTTRPEIIAVSAGADNRHGHPSPEVVERITALDIPIARTDLEGELHFVTDGVTMWRILRQ